MTTRELLYIKTIADEGSMTCAAQKLFVTQPSLKPCVMNIEQQLARGCSRALPAGWC